MGDECVEKENFVSFGNISLDVRKDILIKVVRSGFSFDNVTMHSMENMDQFLHLDITFQQDIGRCYCSFIYAKCSRIARREI